MISLIKQQIKSGNFRFKDPFSALSHLTFAGISLLATPFLLYYTATHSDTISFVSMCLFMLGVLLLYSASGIYHSFDINTAINTRLKKMDHMMIYILIAGTYSPICLISLRGTMGLILFCVIWFLAIMGVLQALFFIHAPKWVNSIIYIAMGWSCIFCLGRIHTVLNKTAFFLLFLGGIIYTIGGVIYALKVPLFNKKHKNFTSHDIFHIFCIGGTLAHYIMMFYLI